MAMGKYGPDYKLNLPGIGPVERWTGEWQGHPPPPKPLPDPLPDYGPRGAISRWQIVAFGLALVACYLLTVVITGEWY